MGKIASSFIDKAFERGWKRSLFRMFVFGAIILPTAAIASLSLFLLNDAMTAREAARRQTAIERDKLFAHAIAHGIAIYVDAARDAAVVAAQEAARRPMTLAGLRTVAANLVDNTGAFWAVSIADPTGKTIVTYDPGGKTEAERFRSGIDISNRDYYARLLQTKRPVVSEAITSLVSPQPTVAVAAPIFGDDGALEGFVAAGVSLSPLYDLARAELGTEEAVPVVVDRTGQVIVHPNQELLASHAKLGEYEPAKRALSGEEGFIDVFADVDGVERSAAYAPVPGLGWGVWVAQETPEDARIFIGHELRERAFFYGIILLLNAILAFVVWRLLKRIFGMHQEEHAYLTSIGDGVVGIDRAWKITLWNPMAAKLTGWSEAEALGKPFRERVKFIRESDRKENLLFIEECMLYGEIRPMSNGTVLLARDGREIPVGDSAAPILDEDNGVTGVVIVFRDVTREKDATLLRTDFAYASHQLRTPVNKALWDLELALEEALPPKVMERLRVAYRSVLDVQKLSTRLLDVSMIDQRQVVPEYEEADVAVLIENVAETLRRAAEERGIRVMTSSAPKGLVLDTDGKLLRGALHELVENAILYGRAGTAVEIEARATRHEVVFQVRDEGLGIPEEQQPLIFTKFFRGQNVPEDAAGSGLGLFVARAYVRLLGGKIWFESKTGKGSDFFVSLPRVRGMKE